MVPYSFASQRWISPSVVIYCDSCPTSSARKRIHSRIVFVFVCVRVTDVHTPVPTVAPGVLKERLGVVNHAELTSKFAVLQYMKARTTTLILMGV
jgi:hypothetical protein